MVLPATGLAVTKAIPVNVPGSPLISLKTHPVLLVKFMLKLYKLAPPGEGVALPLLVRQILPNCGTEKLKLSGSDEVGELVKVIDKLGVTPPVG